MHKSAKKGLAALMAATVLTAPLAISPMTAHALTLEDIKAEDTDTREETEYTLEFELDENLRRGETITVEFDSGFSIKNLRESDVTLRDDDRHKISIDKVKVKSRSVEITVDEKISSGTVLTLTIDRVTNPSSKGRYTISVETENERADSDYIQIGSSSSSSKNSSKDVSVSQSSYEEGATTSITIGKFNLDKSDKLKQGKYIYVDFPHRDMLPRKIDKADVKVNGTRAADVTISGSDRVKIEIPKGADGDTNLKLEFSSDAGIKNPESGSKYTYKITYDSRDYETDSFEIKGGKRSAFDVRLSDKGVGARTSYSFDVSLSERVYADTPISVEFPRTEMIPPVISNLYVTVNGKNVSSLGVSGSKVSFRTPSGFTNSNKLNIEFDYDAFVRNPNTPGSYDIIVTVDGRKYYSSSFDISGTPIVNPTQPTTPPPVPVQVDNSSATLTLTKSLPQTATGMQVAIRSLGMPLVKNRDFIEIVMPIGFRVPAYIAPQTVTLNGVTPAFVGVRGQNLIIVPGQDIPAKTGVNISMLETSGIVTPAAGGVYNIGVYSSEEPGILFSRTVNVVPTNSVTFQASVGSFMKNGKKIALPAAPFAVNGHTLMPAPFFRDGLGVSTTFTNSTAKIVGNGKTIQFKVGSNIATVNGKNVTLPVAVQARNNVPVVPLRFVLDQLQYKISFNNGHYAVFK
ncbi:copper amine oxidase N-terminal domain-containing protein [Brevibacillus ruminantium]|uniref:Copper amine oxidase N-terminal domain-containing protein n=1 Tax=Brevibacillus ruminantium TaxID=2950604 RepID=A0ABY4WFI1_9BACL|nr:copper amine oxidase N-terminal domain-containing protein [Brevibacillus ruminantium]USG65916.1 copper amine oxidase N-terminal domain-containing protein [Brevibacillus ruminantium]